MNENAVAQFVCGRWVERNPIPRGFQAWSQFEVVGEEVARDVRGNALGNPLKKTR